MHRNIIRTKLPAESKLRKFLGYLGNTTAVLDRQSVQLLFMKSVDFFVTSYIGT